MEILTKISMKKFLFVLLLSQQLFGQIQTISGKNIDVQDFENRIGFLMDSLQIAGMNIAVIENGKVSYVKSFGYRDFKSKTPMTNETYFEAASLSKPVFAYFVVKLAQQGKIDLDKPLWEYLPATNISDERYKKITAKMVLSHSTGLPNWSETNTMELKFEPGTNFSYSGEAYMYLARVVAQLTNSSLEDLDAVFQKEIAQKYHFQNFHFETNDLIESNFAKGYQNLKYVRDERDRKSFDAAGGLFSDINSYSEFLIRLINEEPDEMFTPITFLDANDPIRQFFQINFWTIGMGVAERFNGKNYWHAGNNLGYTNTFMINPEKKYGYVFFTNADQCNGMNKMIEKILWD